MLIIFFFKSHLEDSWIDSEVLLRTMHAFSEKYAESTLVRQSQTVLFFFPTHKRLHKMNQASTVDIHIYL